MSDDEMTQGQDDSSQNRVVDPLGIIGWEIGGKYKIDAYIGGGGFGEVYEGHNVNLVEQRVVIKFFKRVQARDKFEKEARILCLLDHPNISRVIDFLPEEGAVVVAYIDGRDGSEFLRESGLLPAEMFFKVARSITGAIAYAHERKIAHRDIKPGNIMFDKNDNVYLIDFGIAKVMHEDATKTAYQALTPMFAAPERQTGDTNYNPFLSDIYELGVTLFNFCTNTMPYRDPTNPNINEWGGPRAKKLSSQLRRVLVKATHPDPTRRYQSAHDMLADINKVDQVYRGKSKAPLVIAAAAVIVIAGAAFFTKDIWLPDSNRAATTRTTESVTPPDNKAPVVPADTNVADRPTTETEQVSGSGAAVETVAIDSAATTPGEVPETGVTENSDRQPEKQPTQPKTTEPVKEPESKPPPEPKPDPLPTLRVQVQPDYNLTLLIDGIQRSQGRQYNLQKGQHDIIIVHPDYPEFKDIVDLQVDKALRYNLADEFPLADSVSFMISAVPTDLGDNSLEIAFNNKGKKYQDLPILDIQKLTGTWNIEYRILSTQGTTPPGIKIDSAVTFPYGNGPRRKLPGAGGSIDFSKPEWQDLESVLMLIYWKTGNN